MAFDPLPIGYTLSSGAKIGPRVGVNTYAITRPAPTMPSAGGAPVAAPAFPAGVPGGTTVVMMGGGGCNGGNGATPFSVAAQSHGASKRPDFGPVVAFTTQTLPAGFKVGSDAFGLVVPEGR